MAYNKAKAEKRWLKWKKGEEKKLLSVVDSIFASGYLTEGGQGIEDTLKTITDAGFTYEIESA